MKSIKLYTLLLTLLLSMMSTDTFAYDFEVDGIYYYLIKGKSAAVTYKDGKYKSYSGKVVIPEKITYEGVEYHVESIGGYAFYNCSSLASITIPNSVTSIGGYAFDGCSGLVSITIPNSVTSIGDGAFENCSSLTSITIPNSVTSIADEVFGECSSLTSVTIPNSVTSIGRYAFTLCSSLTSITIPNSVTSIGGCTFFGCTSLTSIKVDTGNNKYDSRDNCNAIIATSSNTLIAGCKNTTIPNSVTSIGYEAFRGCYALTSITIPNSVTSIGNRAFRECNSLTSVTIPNSVTSIGNHAFLDCSSLTSIKVDAGNNTYDSRDNCNAIIETSTNTLIAGCMNTTIPNSVTSIGGCAFAGCSGLTSITIPNSVTSIGSDAFNGCSKLASITIPNSVTNIRAYAFANCNKLEEVYCHAENVPSTVDDAFKSSNHKSATLYVPASSINDYKTTAPWSQFGTIKEISSTSINSVKESVPVLISANNGFISVKGELDGEPVAVYTAEGKLMGSGTISGSLATVSTSLGAGAVAIVKIGQRAVKVVMR